MSRICTCAVRVVPLFVFIIVLISIAQLLPQTLPIYLESCHCCCLKALMRYRIDDKISTKKFSKNLPSTDTLYLRTEL